MKRFWNFLKNPPLWFLLIAIFLTACSAVASIVFAVLGFTQVWVYIIYGVAGTTLAYSVYTIVKVAPKIKNAIIEMLRTFGFTRQFLDQYHFRAIVMASVKVIINIGYAIFNIVIGIISSSIWFIFIAIYHILLMLLRGDTILSRNKNPRSSFLRCAILLIVLSLTLGVLVWQIVAANHNFAPYGWTIFAVAAWAFYKIITASINMFKMQGRALTFKAIHYVDFADALFSILSLQTSLLYTFSDGQTNTKAFNGATGIVVCLATLAIGIIMLVTITKNNKNKE